MYYLVFCSFSGRQPETWMGRASAALSAVFGAFVMTLPIPVVINSFAGYYRNRLVRRVVLTKRARRLGERRRALRFQVRFRKFRHFHCVFTGSFKDI